MSPRSVPSQDRAEPLSGVAACSDAERRRAEALARELRDAGRDARVTVLWVRPSWRFVQSICALTAVAASIVAVDHALAGLIAAAAALLLATADLSRHPLLRRLTPARATQNVIAPPPQRPGERPVTLILTAATDDPRGADAPRLRVRITSLTLALMALLTVQLAARAGGLNGLALDITQLVPTLALLAVVALHFLTPPPEAPTVSAAATVLEITRRLDEAPPRNLEVAVVMAGAGDAHAAGLRGWLGARRRRGLSPSAVAIIHVEPGAPPWQDRDGLVAGRRAHPQLAGAARRAAGASNEETRRSATTAAGIVRADGWPAIAIGTDAAFGLALVRELDSSLD